MAEAMEESIETAEEAGDVGKLLEIITTCTSHSEDADWAEPTEAALDAYYRLSKGGGGGGGDVVSGSSADPLTTIVSCLAAYQTEEAIVEVGLGCVVAVCKPSANTTGPTNNKNATTSLLVTLFSSFSDEATIQEQACLVVEALASSDDSWKEALAATPGLREQLSAAQTRITNERHKSYPGRAAAALGLEL